MNIGKLNIESFNCGMIENNSYILSDPISNEAMIIDCPDGCDVVVEAVQNSKLKLKYIFLTHGHFDHCWGMDFVHDAFPDVPLIMHFKDKIIYDNLSNDLALFGLTRKPINAPVTFIENNLNNYKLGEVELACELLPGHTPGHLSLRWDGGICSGDVLFYRGIGRTDLFGGNERILYDTIYSHLFQLPDTTVVFPGHGPSTTIGEEKKYNPFVGQLGRI